MSTQAIQATVVKRRRVSISLRDIDITWWKCELAKGLLQIANWNEEQPQPVIAAIFADQDLINLSDDRSINRFVTTSRVLFPEFFTPGAHSVLVEQLRWH